jgi:hypothetical protein
MSRKGGKTWDLGGFWDIVVGFWVFLGQYCGVLGCLDIDLMAQDP